MPFGKLALILLIVLGAAGLTVWVGSFAATSLDTSVRWALVLPVVLAVYVIWRVLAARP
jgi:hypothetical protein